MEIGKLNLKQIDLPVPFCCRVRDLLLSSLPEMLLIGVQYLI